MQVVVLGMHRSGTSLLCGLLELAGIYFGNENDFILINDENPKGFRERKDVRRLNDQLLYNRGCDWSEVSHLGQGKVPEDVQGVFLDQANSVITNLQNSSPTGHIGLKEPRFCLLMDYWLQVLAPDRFFILVNRSAEEIAISLKTRNNIPSEVANYLTEQYLGNAISSIQEERFHITSYSALMTDSHAEIGAIIESISKATGIQLTVPNTADIDSFVKSALYRSKVKSETFPISEQLQHWYAEMAQGNLPRVTSFHKDASRRTLSYEHANRFSEFLLLNTRFKRLESQYFAVTRPVEPEQPEEAVQAYRELRKEVQALSKASQRIEETLELFLASTAWRFSSKLIRLMLSPLRLGKGPTILDELERYREDYRVLSNKYSIPRVDPEFRYLQGDLVKDRQPETSIIVLNRDGENHLELFFSSYLKHHETGRVEIVIVDHGSNDGSLKVIEKYMGILPIKLVAFTQNHSFAFSNNFATRYAIGKYIVFANNDIIFDRPVINELIGELGDRTVGLVGLPLYYADEKGGRSGKLQHAGISFRIDEDFDFARPVNRQVEPEGGGFEREQAAVTGALLACRKEGFVKAGKFCEGYNYGYEDVDLCLTFRTKLDLAVVLSNKTSAIHDESSTQNKDRTHTLSTRRRSNIALLRNRWGHYLEKQRLISKLTGGQWTQHPFRVGLVVTDDSPDTKAGDFFTARELAAVLESEFGWQCSYLPRFSKTRDWYDVKDLDCIIVLLDKYDVSKIHGATGRVIKIAWLRNWFDRWLRWHWFNAYDLYLCSSGKACDFVEESSGKQTHLFKIATNPERFGREGIAVGERISDYCFTGSHWTSPREIEKFDPHNLPYNFALYGVGWKKYTQFADSHKGSLPYEEMPAVYAGTKILVDDANHVTKPWGSVNSRVFDALATGVLVISNGDIGARETFDDLLPVWNSIEDLENKIVFYMENPEEREVLAEKLQKLVIGQHTYEKRAHQLKEILEQEISGKTRVAIKLPVPRIEEVNEWGDYHLGKGLAKSLRALGYSVRLDIMPDWYTTRPIPDDVVITIRGLSAYKPDRRHVNLMWQISHPDKVKNEEYEQYDHVFVASEKYAELLSQRLSTQVSVLLQCTDPVRFAYKPQRQQGNNVVFVGNSRKQLRPIVKDAIAAGLNPAVYGTRWKWLIKRKYIAGQHINNEDLGEFYASAGVVLNDHWETMQENGFISNRLFDAAACGAVVVSDSVAGIDDIFDGLVYVYANGPEELRGCVRDALSEDESRKKQRQDLAQKIAKEHSFDARARTLDLILKRQLAEVQNH